jgi:hypothetical protein
MSFSNVLIVIPIFSYKLLASKNTVGNSVYYIMEYAISSLVLIYDSKLAEVF